MVKLYCITVYQRSTNDDTEGNAVLLKTATNLQSFGFFQRGSVEEFMLFTAKMIVERTLPCCRQTVKQQEYLCHAYVRQDGLSACLVSDGEYPHRVAHTLLTKVLEDISSKFTVATLTPETLRSYKDLEILLSKYQNPNEADALSKIYAELDETKIIMVNTVAAVLKRGENIDELVVKSEGLSEQSKMFYKTARKTNSCCNF